MKRSIFYRLATLATLIFSLASGLAESAYARPPGEADFLGAQLTSEQIGVWLHGLDRQPKSIGIFSVRVHLPLDAEFSEVMQNQIQKALLTSTGQRVVLCEECHTPQVQLKGDRLVVTKGAPDIETMRDFGKKIEVESFMTIDVYRTKLSMVTEVNLYDSATGQIISSEEFKMPAFELNDESVQFMIKFGPGIAIGGDSFASSTSSAPPLAGAFEFLEEVGFGKAGIQIGAAGSGAGSMLFALPTIAWRGRFGATGMTSLKGVGLGFGKSGDSWGVAGGLSYDVFLGSFTSLGLQGYAVIPTSSTYGQTKGINGFIGVSIGFSLGR